MGKININIGGRGSISIGSINQGSNINISSSSFDGRDECPPSPSSSLGASQELNEPCQPSSPKTSSSPVKLFLSYSHKDESFRSELETHLKMLQRDGLIDPWQDHKILPGDSWNTQIEDELNMAEIILLLVSADFIASDYCWEKEVETALTLHDCGQATVVPILLRPCDWQTAKFAQLQGLPTGMKPISAWDDRDQAWTNVAQALRLLIVKRQSQT
jgi:hypothetical protein